MTILILYGKRENVVIHCHLRGSANKYSLGKRDIKIINGKEYNWLKIYKYQRNKRKHICYSDIYVLRNTAYWNYNTILNKNSMEFL